MVFKSIIGATCACLAVVSINANAAMISGQGTWETTLQGRDLDGDISTFEAYYDTTLDITWLADANAAGVSMRWAEANTWAANLNVDGVTGWRLPNTLYPDSTCTSMGGDNFYNCTGSELGHMFYVTLGNSGWVDKDGNEQSDYGLSNTGPFDNIQTAYWSGTEVSDTSGHWWYFHNNSGVQSTSAWSYSHSIWAVHDGDVGAVPIPAAVWLFGSGLIGLIGIARRKA